VIFTVSPRVRKTWRTVRTIVADRIYRQIFWFGIDSADLEAAAVTLEMVDCRQAKGHPPALPQGTLIVFDP
jgi:hypothetical protein